jgi:L-fuconolactonase
MNIIDTHNHLWHCEGEHFSWITPDLAAIRRDFLSDDLREVLGRNQITGSILVQAVPTLQETRWLLNLADQIPQVKGIIGWVDVAQGRAIAPELQRLQAGSPYLKGIRYMSQGLPAEHLIAPDFVEGVRCIGEKGLVYELLITAQQLDSAEQLIARCPDVKFVIEHIGKPAIRKKEVEPWRNALTFIANQHANVYCKLSGMVTEANYGAWENEFAAYDELEPYIDIVLSAFGDRRVMYGSDWPVSLLAMPYIQVLALIQRYIRQHHNISPDRIFHSVAEEFYSI